jgi:hypothetical protein
MILCLQGISPDKPPTLWVIYYPPMKMRQIHGRNGQPWAIYHIFRDTLSFSIPQCELFIGYALSTSAYLLHSNSILLTDCVMVMIIVQNSRQCFQLAKYMQADLSTCLSSFPSNNTPQWHCSEEENLKCVNQVLVTCGPSLFILESRQFWNHPSFQKTQYYWSF